MLVLCLATMQIFKHFGHAGCGCIECWVHQNCFAQVFCGHAHVCTNVCFCFVRHQYVGSFLLVITGEWLNFFAARLQAACDLEYTSLICAIDLCLCGTLASAQVFNCEKWRVPSEIPRFLIDSDLHV